MGNFGKPATPEGDIGQLLRMGWPRAQVSRQVSSQRPASLFTRVSSHSSRISKRSRRPFNNVPRGISRGRQPVPLPSRAPRAERKFDTNLYGLRSVDDFHSGLRRLERDPGSIIVAVHGTFSNRGRLGPRAGYGVFVSGLAEDLNQNGLVPYLSPQTKESAELFAAKKALEIVQDLIMAGEDFTHVIIKSSWGYMVNGLCVHIWKWAQNGFLNSDGQPMMNGRIFQYLHERVVLLEEKYGTRVSFCQVDKIYNEPATALALEAVR
ncbi:hypothetical protein QTJ16_006153 [Diplocarpon rosae]|uniref:RNase H type-1 domain-containing protein n=1 Tax=Diplocarpon rosae TaxID=946125 RepID=A0AAD9ST72_9HELO|nr:hypothetical protein QTJ16_006153 [Diplocarpon rosae]PBP23798.1 hypothetical protein BUE80_DR005473 [Diplocarpon rosae]